MKKLLFLSVAIFSALFANAQNTTEPKEEYIVSTANENWFLNVGAGTEFHLFRDHANSDFNAPTTLRFNFTAGKWFTPWIGFRMGYAYTGFRVQGTNDENSFIKNGTTSAAGASHAVGADVVLHLSNLIGGYKHMRVYDAKLFAGVEGNLTTSKHVYTKDYTPYVGIINEFNVSESFSVNCEIAAGYSHADAYGNYIGKTDMRLVIPVRMSLGLTYYLGKGKAREFKNVKTSNNYVALANINNDLNDKIATLKKSNSALSRDKDALKRELEALKAQKKAATPTTKTEVKVAPVALFFNIGSTNVSKAEIARLKYIAEIIKTEPNTKFVVEGYADSATGSAKRNQVLSDQRAEAVCDVLVKKYGVNRSQLEAKGMGATDSVFEYMIFNRTVIVKSK